MGRHRAFCLVVSIALCPKVWAVTSGCVLSADGTAVAGVELRVFASEPILDRYQRLVNREPRKALEGTTTDEDGGFVLEADLGHGRELHVDALGFAPEVVGGNLSGSLGVVLRKAPMVTGTVTIEGGGPVEGAIVIWSGFDGGEWIAFTDRAGRYEVPDPSKWAGEADVYHPGFGQFSDRVISTHSMVVDPTRVDIEIPAVETIAGRVVDADDGPVGGARISVGGWPVGLSDEAGRFHVQAGLGTTITAVHGDSVGRIDVDSRDVELRLAPGRWIRGRVIDGGSVSALPYASVTVWESRMFFIGRDVYADAEGRYEIGPLPAGLYGVVADSTADGWRNDHAEADLTRARQVSLEHRLERVWSISGRVVDHSGEPLAGSAVMMLGEGDPLVLGTGAMSAAPVAFTGCDGGFEYPLDEYLDTFRVAAIKKDFAPALTAWMKSDPHNGGIELTMPATSHSKVSRLR